MKIAVNLFSFTGAISGISRCLIEGVRLPIDETTESYKFRAAKKPAKCGLLRGIARAVYAGALNGDGEKWLNHPRQ